MFLPVLKKTDNTFDFSCTQKGKDESIAAQWFVYLKEQVIISYNTSDKRWSYDPIREDPKLGLMVWSSNEQSWRQVNGIITKAYGEFVAERELLGDKKDEQKQEEKESSQQVLL